MKPWLRREGQDRKLFPCEVHRLVLKRKFHYEWTTRSKLGKSKVKTPQLMSY